MTVLSTGVRWGVIDLRGGRSRYIYQRGVSIVLSIFILLLLSSLGAAMVQLLTANTMSVAMEVLSARAFLAAQSGIQFQLNVIVGDQNANCTNASVSHEHTFLSLTGCDPVEVKVACDPLNASPSPGDVVHFWITAAGFCGPDGYQASRQVEVQAKFIVR